MTSLNGQLTLFAKDGSNTFYQPINNKLTIGSDEIADCRLNGLKNVAFVINIDSFGRVFIMSYMKRLKVDGKRMPKKIQRPLMNNSVIEILEYKLCWKYDPKFSKSFSMSPCPKPNQPVDKDILAKRRKTVLCFDSTTVKDESQLQSTLSMADNHDVPGASIKNENDENLPSVATTPKKNPLLCSTTSPCRSPFKPIVELHETHDQIIDLEASEEYQTLSETISSQEKCDGEKVIESTPSKRRTSLIPVRENRAAELRRASIRKSLSKSEQSSSMYFTPKKPASSSAMVKGMNAIIRVGLDDEDTVMNKESSITKRNILDTTNLQKLVDTPNKSLTKVIDGMNMFNVVTEQMKKVGSSVYASAKKKGAMNSPRRTPKRGINTPKRQSLRSELAEMGLLPPVQEPSNDDKQQAVAVPANPNLSMEEVDDSDEMECFVISDEEDGQSIKENNKEDVEVSDGESNSDSSDTSESVISVDDESSEESGVALTESIVNITSTLSSFSTESWGTRIQTISDDERKSQLLDAQLTPEETANNDELDDSVFEDNQSASIAAESPTKLNSQQTEIRKRSIYSCGDLTEGTEIHVHDKQTEQQSEDQQTEICYDESSTNQLVTNESEDISIPSTGRKSLIRARRNSRLCSLEECCSPTTFGSPRKTKSAMKVPPSPRSILKTPNAPKTPKTPKRNVRILETILHEEEDEELKITDDNISQTPNLLDHTFEIETESEATESLVRNVSLGNVSLPIENNKSLIGQQSAPSSGLTSEITLEEEQLDSPAFKEIIPSGTKDIEKAQSDKNVSVIHEDGVDERMDSSELSKKNEELQEYQLHSDSCAKNQEEWPISTESNTEIIPSNIKQIHDNSSLNNGRVEELFNSPQPSKEVIPSVIDEAQLDTKTGVDDAYEVDERMDSSELSKKNEKMQECQLNSDSGDNNGEQDEERPNSPESNTEIIPSDINQLQDNSCVKNQEERTNSPESIMEIIPSDIKQLQDNSSVNIGPSSNASKEVIPSVIEEAPLNTNTGVDDAYEVDERMDSSELSKENEKLQECQLNSDSCHQNGEQDEERPNSPESITEIIPSDIKQLQDNSGVNNGPSSKASKEVISSVIEEASLNTNISVDDAYEVDERMYSSELSKKNEKLQECQLNSDSCENDGEQVEERPNSSEPNTEIIPSDIKQIQDNSCVKSQEERTNSPESITEIIPSDIKQLQDNSGVNNGPSSNAFEKVIPSVIEEAQLNTNTCVDDAYEVDERMDSSELSKKNEKMQECQLNSDSCENDGEQVEERPNSFESKMEMIHSDIKQLQDNSCVKNQEERSDSPESITEIIPSDIKQLEDNSGLTNNGRVGERFDLPQPSNDVIPSVIEEAQLDTNNGFDDAYKVDEEMDSSELSKKNENLQECQLDSDSCENNGEHVEELPNSPESVTEIIPSVIEEAQLNTDTRVHDAYDVDERMDSSERSKKNEKLQECELDSDRCENNEEKVEEQPNSPESNSKIIPSDIENLNNERVAEQTNSLESTMELILSGIKQEPELNSNNGLNDGEVIGEQINSSETNIEISVPCVKELQETLNERDEAEWRTNSLDVISSAIEESHLETCQPANNEEQVEQQHNLPESNSEIIASDIEELNNERVVEPTNSLEPNTELILSGIKQEPELDSNSGLNDVEGIGEQINSSETNMEISVPCVKELQETLNERDEAEWRTNSPEVIAIEESHLNTYRPKNNGEQVEEQHNSPESNSEILPSDIEELNNEQTNSLEPSAELILSGIKQEPELDSNSGLNDVEGSGEQINSSKTDMEISVQCVKELQETLNDRNEIEGRTNSPEPCKEVIPSVNEELPEAKLDLNTSVNDAVGVYERIDVSEPNKKNEKRQECILPYDSSMNNEGKVQEPDLNMEISVSCINELQEAQLDSNSGLTDGEDIEEPTNSSKTDVEVSVQCVKELQETLNDRNEVEGPTNSLEPCKEVISSVNGELPEAKLDLNICVNGAGGVYERIDSSEPNKKNEERQECLLHYDSSTNNEEKVQEPSNLPDLNMEISISDINELQEAQLDSSSGQTDGEGIGEQINSSKTNDEISFSCVKKLQVTLPERDGVEEYLNSPDMFNDTIENKQLQNSLLESNKNAVQVGECTSKFNEYTNELVVEDVNDEHEVGELLDSSKLHTETRLVGIEELVQTQSESNSSNDEEQTEKLSNSPEIEKEISLSSVNELQNASMNSNDEKEVNNETSSENKTGNESCKNFSVAVKYKSRETILHTINNALTSIGMNPLKWCDSDVENAEKEKGDVSNDISSQNPNVSTKDTFKDGNADVKLKVDSLCNEMHNDSSLSSLPTENMTHITIHSESAKPQVIDKCNDIESEKISSASSSDEANSDRKMKITLTDESEAPTPVNVESQAVSETAVHLPSRKGRKTKTTDDPGTSKPDRVEPPKITTTPAVDNDNSSNIPTQRGHKVKTTVTNDMESTESQCVDSQKVSETRKTKIPDDSETPKPDAVELQEISLTPAIEKDHLSNVPPRRGRKIQTTVMDDSEETKLESVDSEKVPESPVTSENDVHLPTKRGYKNKTKIADDSETTDTVELQETPAEVPPRRGRKMQPSVTKDSEETKLKKLDSKKVTETPAASENDANILTKKGRKNKAKIADGSETTDIVDLPKKSATPAVEKDDLTNVPLRKGRKIKSTVTNDSEEAELEKLDSKKVTETTAASDNDANIPTKRGRTNKAKIADGSETADTVELPKKSATTAVEKDDLTNVPLRRGRKIHSTVTNDLEEAELEKLDSKKVIETPAASDNDANIPTKRGRTNKAKIVDDSETTDTVELPKKSAMTAVEKDDLTNVPLRRGRKIQSTVTNDSEEAELKKLDSKKVIETPAASENDANIPSKRGRRNKAKIADGSETTDTVELPKKSATPAVGKDDLTNVPLRRGRKNHSTVTNDSEEAELEKLDSKKITEIPVASDNDANIPTKKGRTNKAKIADGSETTDTVELPKKSATPAVGKDDLTNVPLRRGRKNHSTVTNDSEEAELEKLDSKKVTEIPVASDNDANIPTKKGRTNKAKIADGSETTDTVELPKKSATPAVGKDDLTNVPLRRGRKNHSTVTNDSEEAELEKLDSKKVTEIPVASDNDANIPTKKGRTNKAKIADGSETTDTVELPKKSATPAVGKDDLTNVPLRRGRKIQSTVTNESEETELEKLDSKRVTETPAASDNNTNIRTRRGRQNKTNIADDSKTLKPDTADLQKISATPAIEKDDLLNVPPGRGRKIEATVTNDSQKVTETGEDDPSIPTRKGRTNKTKVATGSKTSKPDTVQLEKISSTPAVDDVPVRRGRKVKRTVSNISQATESSDGVDSQNGMETLVTGDDDLSIPAKRSRKDNKKTVANSETVKPEAAPTRRGRKVEKIEDSSKIKDSQSSTISTRKRRRLSEVESLHSEADAVKDIQASKVLKRTNRNTATHVSDEPEASKRRKVDVLKVPITRALRGSRNIEMNDELIQPKQIKHNENRADPIIHNLRSIPSANVDEATSSTSLGAKSSVKANNRPKRRNK